MAYLIPENLRGRRDVSPGVARLAAALRDGLDDDVIVWYEPMFDVTGKRPDLVVLLPYAGILMIEVLESRATAIHGVRDGRLLVVDGEREREVQDPLSRATNFARYLSDRIGAEPRLAPADRLAVAAAAALPYLSQDAAAARHLGDALPLERCLYRDDIEDGVAGGSGFRRRMMQLLGVGVRDPLSERAESLHRAIIHPDTVIGSRQLPFPALARAAGEDELLVLDRKQEALAKTLGVGHRVIRGAAGSGKTLVLTYRARLLAETFPGQRVLVTCFTRALAGRLRHQLSPWSNITVNNLDALMARARRAADLDPVDYNKFSRDELAERALTALDAQPESIARYHHVLIDEAQDFPTPALQFAVRLLVEGSDSLLAVADPVQNIFQTHFTWKAAGINAVGRTRWLDQSYRNTREILEYAHNFVMRGGGFAITEDPDPDSAVDITVPTFSPRSGPIPHVLESPSRQAEVLYMGQLVAALLAKGEGAGDIAILYGSQWTGNFNWPETIRAVFDEQHIPMFWANDPDHRDNRDHIGEDPSLVVVSTIHGAKGLEFRHVILCGYLDDRPPEESKISRSLIYVGMTRATHELTLSASGRHPYLVDLERS